MLPFLNQGRWKKAVHETLSDAAHSHMSPKGGWKRGFERDFVLLSLVTWGYCAIHSINCSSQLSVNWNDCFNSWESVGHELWPCSSPLATSFVVVWILWNPLLIQCWLEAILNAQEIWDRKILRKYKPFPELVYCKDREMLSGLYQGS